MSIERNTYITVSNHVLHTTYELPIMFDDLGLTDKQKKILSYWMMGFSAKEIGNIIGKSQRTVEMHQTAIYRKLECYTLYELRCKYWNINK
jgi:DNA-binding CsgD family transcriptional regulator